MALMSFREPNQVKWVGVRPAHDGTQVIAEASGSNNIAIVYTVPVGQVFHLCNAYLSLTSIAASNPRSEIRTGGAAHVWWIFYSNILAGVLEFNTTRSFWPPVEMPAGYDIVVTTGVAGCVAQMSIFGWYEEV